MPPRSKAPTYPVGPPVYSDGTPVGAADVAWVGDLPGRVLYFTARGAEWFLTVEQPDRPSATVPARHVHPPR